MCLYAEISRLGERTLGIKQDPIQQGSNPIQNHIRCEESDTIGLYLQLSSPKNFRYVRRLA